MLYGGGAGFPGCLAFLSDEQNGFVMAPLTNVVVTAGVTGPGSNRSGDYLTTRNNYPRQSSFGGTCFSFATTTSADARFAVFGRADLSSALFRNGFETGNSLVWSAQVP